MYGYFERPEQKEPTYDPGIKVDCPFCKLPLNFEDLRTISFMAAEHPTRSYFYRAHKSCHEAAPESLQQAFECLPMTVDITQGN